MPYALQYPIDARRTTLTYELVTDHSLGAPQVAETPTLGFPFELSVVDIRNARQGATTMQLTLLAATNPWVSGDPRIGYILHRVAGNSPSVLGRDMVYYPLAPLILRPRIRFPTAGWRLRLVHEVVDGTSAVRVILVLTPLD